MASSWQEVTEALWKRSKERQIRYTLGGIQICGLIEFVEGWGGDAEELPVSYLGAEF